MVCRENKGRSAVMGLLKRQMASRGYSDYRDYEFQSAIHEYGHTFQGADEPSPEEYRDFLRGARQQVVNDTTIPDAEKYRQSHKQPGVVTRIDQEIKRVETGRDENGRPLRPEQINGGRHFQSMKHMSAILTRGQEAKQEYHELYARSMGISASRARSRYNTLAALPREERENTEISLTDSWRDDLNVAGISRKTQGDIGQSNEARFALATMESERQAHLRALPTRDAFEGDHVQKVSYITPEEAAKRVKCDTCGQFGHEEGDCPNVAEFETLVTAEGKVLDARAELDQQQDAAIAALALKANEGSEFGPESRRTDDGRYHVNDGGPPAATVDEWRDRMRAVADRHDPAAVKKAQKEYVSAQADATAARDAFEAKRGPVPQVSSAVTEVKYNEGSGALMVTRPGYTRKSDGVTMPPKDYLYVMGSEEFKAFKASDSPGRFLSETTGRAAAKGGNGGWTPQNEAEAKALMTEKQCPTCGRWASMTAGHQCPVPDGRQGEVDAATAERAREARERARLDSLPVNMGDTTKRVLVQSHTAGEIRNGRITFPNPRAMSRAREDGAVGMGGFTAQYFGATVNGRAYTWTDPSTGESVFTAREVRCSACAGSDRCIHVDKAADMMANHYRATRVSQTNPGNRVFRREAEQASDAREWHSTEETYQQIRDRRAANADRVIANARIDPNLRQAAVYPRDADGTPVRWPSTYDAPGGRNIRVDDNGEATRQEVTSVLSERTGRKWITEPDGRGGFTITTPKWRRLQDGRIPWGDRKALREALDIPARGSGDGYHVPADSSWRHETLSRLHERQPSIHGARRVMHLSDSPGPDA